MDSSNSDDDRHCYKKAKIEDSNADDDRISKLPNAILGQILSSFPTKRVVGTSILSKRWRYVWTSVPNLEFYDKPLVHCNKRKKLEKRNCFMDFVNRVLDLNTVSSLQKFCISCYEDYSLSCVTAWINGVITREVDEIQLSFITGKKIALPRNFYTSKKLVVLTLGPKIALDVPELVDFPNLKVLSLNHVHFVDDDSLKILLSGCPVLEELYIYKKSFDNITTLYILSSSLKTFKLEYFDSDKGDLEHRVVIESPNLQYLDMSDTVTEDFKVSMLPSLLRVDLDLMRPDKQSVEENVYVDRLMEIFRKILSTEFLKLGSNTLQSIPYEYLDNLPVFHNLSCLEVVVQEDCWEILPSLLQCSPNISSFILEKCVKETMFEKDADERLCEWVQPGSVPKCLLISLQNILIRGFEAGYEEMQMADYFLKNGKVLQKMLIQSINVSSKQKSYVRKKLMKSSKASSKCQISLY